jgi:hypothetical protein
MMNDQPDCQGAGEPMENGFGGLGAAEYDRSENVRGDEADKPSAAENEKIPQYSF